MKLPSISSQYTAVLSRLTPLANSSEQRENGKGVAVSGPVDDITTAVSSEGHVAVRSSQQSPSVVFIRLND
jgi:hypothetical protein